MPVTDPIADMITRVRNANSVGKDHVDVPASRVKLAITKILKEEGYIKGFKNMRGVGPQGTLRLFMKYGPNGEKVITDLQRMSKPGLRRYAGNRELPRVLDGLGVAIVSTSKGIMTDRQARRRKIGGEVMCAVW
jgi:small subunit ribosomal protein S8